MARLKALFFYQNSPKIRIFLKKKCKIFRPQHSSLPFAAFWRLAWKLCTVYNNTRFRSFCFEQFFLGRSVANLMMLIIDLCLMLKGGESSSQLRWFIIAKIEQ